MTAIDATSFVELVAAGEQPGVVARTAMFEAFVAETGNFDSVRRFANELPWLPWTIATASPGSMLNPTKLAEARSTGGHIPTVLAADCRADRFHPEDRPGREPFTVLYRAGCLGCDFEGPIRDDETHAVIDAHDHTHPWWRELPVVDAPKTGSNGKPSKKALEEIRTAYEAAVPGCLDEPWCPIRTWRDPPGTRSHPGGLLGGYDLGVERGTEPAGPLPTDQEGHTVPVDTSSPRFPLVNDGEAPPPLPVGSGPNEVPDVGVVTITPTGWKVMWTILEFGCIRRSEVPAPTSIRLHTDELVEVDGDLLVLTPKGVKVVAWIESHLDKAEPSLAERRAAAGRHRCPYCDDQTPGRYLVATEQGLLCPRCDGEAVVEVVAGCEPPAFPRPYGLVVVPDLGGVVTMDAISWSVLWTAARADGLEQKHIPTNLVTDGLVAETDGLWYLTPEGSTLVTWAELGCPAPVPGDECSDCSNTLVDTLLGALCPTCDLECGDCKMELAIVTVDGEDRPRRVCPSCESDLIPADYAGVEVADAFDTAPLADDEPCTIAEATQITQEIREHVRRAWDRIVEAYRRRVWVPLGYESWDAYCAGEFDGAQLRLPREERAETIQSLRDAGLSIRAIASATGTSVGTVSRDLDGAPPSGVPNGTPDAESPALPLGDDFAPPATIRGADGKTYKATGPVETKSLCGLDGCREHRRPTLDFCDHHHTRLDRGEEIDDGWYGACPVNGCGQPIPEPGQNACPDCGAYEPTVNPEELGMDPLFTPPAQGEDDDQDDDPDDDEPDPAPAEPLAPAAQPGQPEPLYKVGNRRLTYLEACEAAISDFRSAVETMEELAAIADTDEDTVREMWRLHLVYVEGSLREIRQHLTLGVSPSGISPDALAR